VLLRKASEIKAGDSAVVVSQAPYGGKRGGGGGRYPPQISKAFFGRGLYPLAFWHKGCYI